MEHRAWQLQAQANHAIGGLCSWQGSTQAITMHTTLHNLLGHSYSSVLCDNHNGCIEDYNILYSPMLSLNHS